LAPPWHSLHAEGVIPRVLYGIRPRQRRDGTVVNVSNWPDYIAPGLIEQFTAETGIRVNYSTFDGNEMLETKLLTGNSGYDVVVPSAAFLQRQVAAGAYQPIDRARLSNYAISIGMMALLATNDPGNLHGVGHMWGTTGIAYDARKVTALVPDAPTDSWRLVFDPRLPNVWRAVASPSSTRHRKSCR